MMLDVRRLLILCVFALAASCSEKAAPEPRIQVFTEHKFLTADQPTKTTLANMECRLQYTYDQLGRITSTASVEMPIPLTTLLATYEKVVVVESTF